MLKRRKKPAKSKVKLGLSPFFAPTVQLGAPDLCQFSCHAICCSRTDLPPLSMGDNLPLNLPTSWSLSAENNAIYIHNTTLYIEHKMPIEMHRKKETIVVDTVYCINCGAAIWIIASTIIAPLPGLLHALYFRPRSPLLLLCLCCMSNPASLASSAESGFASSPRLSCTASAISDTGHKWEGKNYLSVSTLWNMLKINQTKYCITTITAL